MRTNTLKAALNSGRVVVGSFIHLPSPHITEIVGSVGFDYLVIDMEHSPATLETVEHMIRAGQTTPTSVIVRPKSNDPGHIATALDCGADGVLIPHIETEEQARMAVASALYPPEGERSVCHSVRSAGYHPLDQDAYFSNANSQTTVDLLVEGAEGVENFEKIVSVPGVDTVFIGPADLSAAVGVPGQYEHDLVLNKIKELTAYARERDVNVCTVAWNLKGIGQWIDAGINNIVFGSDAAWITWAFRRNFGRLEEVMGPEWKARRVADTKEVGSRGNQPV